MFSCKTDSLTRERYTLDKSEAERPSIQFREVEMQILIL